MEEVSSFTYLHITVSALFKRNDNPDWLKND